MKPEQRMRLMSCLTEVVRKSATLDSNYMGSKEEKRMTENCKRQQRIGERDSSDTRYATLRVSRITIVINIVVNARAFSSSSLVDPRDAGTNRSRSTKYRMVLI